MRIVAPMLADAVYVCVEYGQQTKAIIVLVCLHIESSPYTRICAVSVFKLAGFLCAVQPITMLRRRKFLELSTGSPSMWAIAATDLPVPAETRDECGLAAIQARRAPIDGENSGLMLARFPV